MNKRNLIATLLLIVTTALNAMSPLNDQSVNNSQNGSPVMLTTTSPITISPMTTSTNASPMSLRTVSPIFSRVRNIHRNMGNSLERTEAGFVHPDNIVMVNGTPVHHNRQVIADHNARNQGIEYSDTLSDQGSLLSIDNDEDQDLLKY
jgi:hypothetical protein